MNLTKSLTKELKKKLTEANWVCNDCGDKYGERPDGHVGTFHDGICDVCGEEKSITEPRDFTYFYKTLGR